MIADMLTIKEHLGKLKGVKFVYMGDARYNMGNSLMVTCAKLGMHFVACTNPKYYPDKKLVDYCVDVASTTGATITLTDSVRKQPGMLMSFIQMYGYPWVNRKKYGQSVSMT